MTCSLPVSNKHLLKAYYTRTTLDRVFTLKELKEHGTHSKSGQYITSQTIDFLAFHRHFKHIKPTDPINERRWWGNYRKNYSQ